MSVGLGRGQEWKWSVECENLDVYLKLPRLEHLVIFNLVSHLFRNGARRISTVGASCLCSHHIIVYPLFDHCTCIDRICQRVSIALYLVVTLTLLFYPGEHDKNTMFYELLSTYKEPLRISICPPALDRRETCTPKVMLLHLRPISSTWPTSC